MSNKVPKSIDEAFYGSATVGERGQIVIPADARKDLGIGPGDKLIFMKHPIIKALMVAKFEDMLQHVDEMNESIERARKRLENEKA